MEENNIPQVMADQLVKEIAEEPKKPLTEHEIRKLRKLYITRQHPMAECGHKFAPQSEPKNNCEICWFTFFNTYGELTKSVEEAYQKEGQEFLIAVRGIKFIKMFKKFMGTVAKFVQESTQVENTSWTRNKNPM